MILFFIQQHSSFSILNQTLVWHCVFLNSVEFLQVVLKLAFVWQLFWNWSDVAKDCKKICHVALFAHNQCQ